MKKSASNAQLKYDNAPISSEVIRPRKYADGQDAMGTPKGAEHHTHTSYLDAAAKKHRADLRGTPAQNNPKVTSKGDRNAAVNHFKPSDSRQPSTTIQGRDLPSGIHSRDVHGPGTFKHVTVGHLPNSGGKFKAPTYPNSAQAKQSAENHHRAGAASKPSGRTITK